VLLVAPRETLVQLRGSLQLDETTGWAIAGKGGVGTIALTLPDDAADTRSPTQRCAAMVVRNPYVERVFIAVSLEGIVRSGLPLDRFDTIVCLGCKPEAAWEQVMRDASESYTVAKDLPSALRKCGLAAAAKKSAKSTASRAGGSQSVR
jgi:hypothetical protein